MMTAVKDMESHGVRDPATVDCHGGCHCGAVRFRAAVDPAAETRRCNCSRCRRTRFWKVFTKPDTFRLLQGATVMKEYRFGNDIVGHGFCGRCGMHLFMRIERLDADADGFVVNLACLDDESRAMALRAPVRFEDGRNDDWWSEPEIRYL